jgi:two-component system OmpR family sensor kinase
VRFLTAYPRHSFPHKESIEAGLDERLGTEVYAIVLAPDGTNIATRPSGLGSATDPRPVLPSSVRLAPDVHPGKGAYRPSPDDFNLTSRPTAGHAAVTYRARAAGVPEGTVITAIALTSTDITLANLIRIELGVSAVVLVALCLVALWTVRRGLRPLEDMAVTAGAIASGDLSRRVETADPTTEVGRLGTALNAMLVQIEAGFDEKSATEERLRRFVADASHELRTPLTSIRGYAELLRKGAFVDEVERQRALARVEHEAARMGGLVDDLLLLARLDQGRPLERLPVDLSRICRDAVFDANMTAPERVVLLDTPQPVMVAGDRDRLVQVAHNLIRNALVHTPPTTAIEVRARASGANGVLEVVDHGPGITPAGLERVFDRFYRLDSARTGQGTGLGLSIVRAIAEAFGGRAYAGPTPGGGATFCVELPLVPPAARAAGSAPEATPSGTARRRPELRRKDRRAPMPAAPALSAQELGVLTRAGTGPAPGPRGPGRA